MMKKLILSLLLFVVAVNVASAQFTNVTGTIVDQDATTWFNARVTVTFNPNPNYPQYNQYYLNGQQITTNPAWNAMLSQTVVANTAGQFAVQVLDSNQISPGGSSWKFVIQSYTSAPSSVFPALPLTTANIDVSAFIATNITLPRFPASNSTAQGGAYGYGTEEISVIPVPGGSFWNNTTGVLEIWTCIPSGCSWESVNGNQNCSTIPGCGPSLGFTNSLAVGQGTTDTTIVLNGSTTGYPTQGTVLIDSEWEFYTGISGNTLTGVTRGYSQTTPASHGGGTDVSSVNLSFNPSTQAPQGGIFNYPGIGQGQILVNGCGHITGMNDNGSIGVLQLNCDNSAFIIDSAGRIHQLALGNIANFMAPIYIGSQFQDTPNGESQPIPILNSTNVIQNNNPNQASSAVGFTQGLAGKVKSIPSPIIGGLTLTPNFLPSGGCAVTYVVTGIDADGNTVPGTPTTVTGITATWSVPSSVGVQAPPASGVVTYNLYRTTVIGCASLTTGLISSASSQFPSFADQYQVGDGSTAPITNTTIPGSCVGSAANSKLYCQLAGSSTTPPQACAAASYGWDYVNVAATASPSHYHCYSGGSTWTALSF